MLPELCKELSSPWYTVKEAVAYLGVSRSTIYAYIRSKDLPAYRMGKKGHRRFRIEDLGWLKKMEEIHYET